MSAPCGTSQGNFAGGREVLKDVTLAFLPGAKIGVLGVNGAGKSTLMKIMAGEDKEYNGDAWAAGGKVGILKQERISIPTRMFTATCSRGWPKPTHCCRNSKTSALSSLNRWMRTTTALIEKQGELQEKIDAADGWDLERKLEIAMDALRCPLKDADVSKLSGGERPQGRVVVGYCYVSPDLLLLDEPTNHLDAESVAWLEHHLEDYKIPSWRSPMTGISLTTSPAGYWN